MIKRLTPLILITFFFNYEKEKKMKNEKVVLFKTPIMKSLLSHFTPRNAPFLYRERRFHIFLNRNGWGEERFPFLGYSREQIQWRRGGACSSEDQSTWLRTTVSGVRIPPRPQLAKKGRTFPFGGRKIMIGIADPKLWNLGVGLLSKWNGLTLSFSFFNL